MTKGKFGPPARLQGPDYEQIEAAVMETARGRWFLAEYARRNRTADTELLLKAIDRLQNVVAGEENRGELEEMRASLLDMAAAIARLRRELFSENDGKDGGRGAPQELDAIVIETEEATHKILRIGERIQEIAWSLREQGVRASICDGLDAGASEIFAACSFQDLTGQKMARVVALLRMIEERLESVIDRNALDDLVLRSTPADGPRNDDLASEPLIGAAVAEKNEKKAASQSEVDDLLAPSEPVSTENDGQSDTTERDVQRPDAVLIDIEDSAIEVREVEPADEASSNDRSSTADLSLPDERADEAEMTQSAPGTAEESDGDDDLANFNRLSAELEAAATPASRNAHWMVAPGDIAFAEDEGGSGNMAESGQDEPILPGQSGDRAMTSSAELPPIPEGPQSESAASAKAGRPRAGDPVQTGWDAEFNRLSPAHRMALFS